MKGPYRRIVPSVEAIEAVTVKVNSDATPRLLRPAKASAYQTFLRDVKQELEAVLNSTVTVTAEIELESSSCDAASRPDSLYAPG